MLVGTTDNDFDGDIDRVPPSGDDVEYLLGALNDYFEHDLDPDDLTGAYAGVRPLIASGDPKKSVDISRKAELYETSSGMLTITGGKLTTFRRMAAQVVDRITERDGQDGRVPHRRHPAGDARPRPRTSRPASPFPTGRADQLAFRYGHAARAVLDLCEERTELAAPIVPGHPDLLAEVVIAARVEQARSVADVLLRRTRLGLVAARELQRSATPRRRWPAAGRRSSAGADRGSRPRPRSGARWPRRRDSTRPAPRRNSRSRCLR